MKIVVLNGSPKGEYSITLQYLIFLQKKFTEHDFLILNIAQKIKKIEKDEKYFKEVIDHIDNADVIIWSFGLWVLAVSAQLMRFIELVWERKAHTAFAKKYAAGISTSIRFYDHTAHNYIRAECEDLGMKFIDSVSFYILDFMKDDKRKDLVTFFKGIASSVQNKYATKRVFSPLTFSNFVYKPTDDLHKVESDKKVLIVTDSSDTDTNLGRMIEKFSGSFNDRPEIININSIDIRGACLGCMKCGYDYECQYKDGFKDFYNKKVRSADILIFAGEMKRRYLSSTWKTFFDRAFFWNHTPSLLNKQIAYIISGPMSQNSNLLQILEGNVTTRQLANLVDIVSDECADSSVLDNLLQKLAEHSVYYANIGFVRPQNFMEVGGHKIFRDEIFGHIRGVWQADHRYFKKNGLYDFEQKKIGIRMVNFVLLMACKFPGFRKKYYGNIKKIPSQRFGKLMDNLEAEQKI